MVQEGPDEAMRQAPAASRARNVKPRVEVSGEDSTRVSSRMEDGGSEEMGPPDDPTLTPADESTGISEMTVILMSLIVAPANFKVAEWFCRNRFDDTVVDMGFERGPEVDYATGRLTWMMRSRWSRWSGASVMKSQCC